MSEGNKQNKKSSDSFSKYIRKVFGLTEITDSQREYIEKLEHELESAKGKLSTREEKEMIRAMLSESLQAVISQTLCKTKDGSGRVAAHEIMIGTSAIRNLIREAKVAQMYSAIQTGNSVGMITLDQNLTDLVKRNMISPAEARSKAKIPENFPG